MSDEAPDLADGMQPSRPEPKNPGLTEPAYKVYSTRDDEVTPAEALCEPEELERLRDDYPPLSRPNELKRRQALWLERLQAKPI